MRTVMIGCASVLSMVVVSVLAGSVVGNEEVVSSEGDFSEIKSQAEKYYAEKSYAKAHELYEKIDLTSLASSQAQWVRFRLADTQWRSAASTRRQDKSQLDTAQRSLEMLHSQYKRDVDRDRTFAELCESLGDYWWHREGSRDWSRGWQYYRPALKWWAASSDIELARRRYLDIVWKAVEPEHDRGRFYHAYYGSHLPIGVIENVLKIAETPSDKAHGHCLMAMTLLRRGQSRQRMLIASEFEQALALGKKAEWYDDALFQFADYLANRGIPMQQADGTWQQEPDFVAAVKRYKQLINEYEEGETRYYDDAINAIENITKSQLGVHVSNIFLPGSEIQYHINWRNIQHVAFSLHKIDLTSDMNQQTSDSWLESIEPAMGEQMKSWSFDTKDKGDHVPGGQSLYLDERLPIGAYLLLASGGGEKARALVLVTDATLVSKLSHDSALVYFCNAGDGAPIPNAPVSLWDYYQETKRGETSGYWHQQTAVTDEQGLCRFQARGDRDYRRIFVAANSADRQAFLEGHKIFVEIAEAQIPPGVGWKIYAFTDRPAYRPDETVHWRFIARQYNGDTYHTPEGKSIRYIITDPQGSKIKEDTASLNAFGGAFGDLALKPEMPLGEYRVNFQDAQSNHHIGNATLFRLEEYKLPEFKVVIQTPEEEGQKKSYRLGDEVEVTIQADYYFGGPVADADVEVIVAQQPFYHDWHPPHRFPWYYEDSQANQFRHHYGSGQIIKREAIKTDATGRATLTFETPIHEQQDLEYRIEARVTDASRREIVASDRVRVTRQRYYVYMHPEHNIYVPNDQVTVNIKALDANEQPISAEGSVTVTRDYWWEVWVSPAGEEISGPPLEKLRQSLTVFPPPPVPNQQGWRVKFRGYKHDEILTRTIKLDAEGKADLTFTPNREGYYRVAWQSPDPGSLPITSATTVWVATGATEQLGYRHDGVQIIVDKDTFQAGQSAPVMIVAPTNDHYVLFTIEGENLIDHQLVHLDGTVKLLTLDIQEKHVPNIFLNAMMVTDHQLHVDQQEVVVPPVKNFLEVELTPDQGQYQPQQEGTWTVTTRNHEGDPVSAELALGVVDESVYYIQQEYAGDPRQFFFGWKRHSFVRMNSSFEQNAYIKLLPASDPIVSGEDDMREWGGRYEDAYSELSSRGGRGARGAVAEASVPMRARAMEQKSAGEGMSVFGGGGAKVEADISGTLDGESAVMVRSDFRSTALWRPDVVTDENGRATIQLTYPDSLTTWKAQVRVATAGNQFGIADASVKTQLPLIVRLQAPRFFVVGDEVTLSAVVNNNTDRTQEVVVDLSQSGMIPIPEERVPSTAERERDPGISLDINFAAQRIKVPAGGEARADWRILARVAGDVTYKVAARSDTYADAMEKTYPVYEHGIMRYLAKAGKVRGDEVAVTLHLPKERKPETTRLNIQIAPSLAVTMLDALPYLADYPYGCTEQTMSRFLPAAITRKTLQDLGLDATTAMNTVFGGIERAFADKTHTKGPQDLRRLDEMIRLGLDRLYDFQHADGGWGWWKPGDSDHFMTAYVVWGLTLAQQADIDVDQEVLGRGVDCLTKELVEEERNFDRQAWMLHAITCQYFVVEGAKSSISRYVITAFENLWVNRDKLNAYTRALLALSAHYLGRDEEARILIENLDSGVVTDESPDTSVVQRGEQASHAGVVGTAHWGEDGIYYRWSEGGVEATAFVLKALLTIDPNNTLIEPTTNWLIKNRRGAQWSNTRDTAIVVLAMNDYLKVSGELAGDIEYELLVNGESIDRVNVSAEEVLSAPRSFEIPNKGLQDGDNEILIRRIRGTGPLYFMTRAEFFSLEEPIPPAGHEIFVRRQYHKLVGRPTLLAGYVYEKQPLNDQGTVTSGERVEVVLTIEAKNNYEYLVFEDLKPAGLEAVQLRSGEPLYAERLRSNAVQRRMVENRLDAEPDDYTGHRTFVYQELRDRKIALFISGLPEGVWEIRYELRAEVPGTFHALPVMGHAMYVPEIKCNGQEIRMRIED